MACRPKKEEIKTFFFPDRTIVYVEILKAFTRNLELISKQNIFAGYNFFPVDKKLTIGTLN